MSKNEMLAKLELLNEWEKIIEEAKNEAEELRNEIKAEMGNEEHVEVGGFTVNYTIVISTTLDSKKLKAEMPSLWEQYKREGITRRFSIS